MIYLATIQFYVNGVYFPIDQSTNLSWSIVGVLTLFIIGLTTILFVYNFFYSAHLEGPNASNNYEYPFDLISSAVPGSCMEWPLQSQDCTCFVKDGWNCRKADDQSDNQSTAYVWPSTKCSAPSDRKGQFVVHLSNKQTRNIRSYTVLPLLRYGNGMPAAHKPRSIMIWCPDIYSHSGHSMHFAQYLALNGHAMMSVDYPTFGESREPFVNCSDFDHPGTVKDWHSLVESVEQFICDVAERFPSTPLFIGGEGIGATIALHIAARHSKTPIATSVHIIAMVLVNPALKSRVTWKEKLWISMCTRLMPAKLVPPLWPIELVSRNRAVHDRQ